MNYNLNFTEKTKITNERTPTLIMCFWKNLVISLEITISIFIFFLFFHAQYDIQHTGNKKGKEKKTQAMFPLCSEGSILDIHH